MVLKLYLPGRPSPSDIDWAPITKPSTQQGDREAVCYGEMSMARAWASWADLGSNPCSPTCMSFLIPLELGDC